MVKSSETPLIVTFTLTTAVALLVFAVGIVRDSHRIQDEGLVIFGTALLMLFSAGYLVRQQLRTVLQGTFRFRSADIYFSFAYLYRIRTKSGHYLLVKHKENDYFQPVGGVYKCHPSSDVDAHFAKIGARLQTSPAPHRLNDLRGHIPGRNLHAIFHWFRSQKQREIVPLREFYEELVSTAPPILDPVIFRYIDFRYAGTIWSPVFRMERGEYGAFVHEVYDLVADQAQSNELDRLHARGHPDICFATASEIMQLGHSLSSPKVQLKISRHTRNMLILAWS